MIDITNEDAEQRGRVKDGPEAERALRASEAKLRRITESGIVGIFYWNMERIITEANYALLKMIGRTRSDIEGGQLDWRTLTLPEWVAEDERRAAEVIERGVAGPGKRNSTRKRAAAFR